MRPLAGGQKRGALAGAPLFVLAIRYIFDNILNFAIKNSAYSTNYIERNVFILCEFYHRRHRSPDFLPEFFPRHSTINEQVQQRFIRNHFTRPFRLFILTYILHERK